MNTDPLNKEKRAFLSVLSHELRNPLSAILSSAELLKLQIPPSADTTLLLETIEERVRGMTHTLNTFLDQFNAPEKTDLSAGTHPQPSPIDDAFIREHILPSDAKTYAVLIVDDNEMAARALGQLLQLQGHTVTIAYTGTEAIEKALHLRPQIIILDIGLPDMNGYEVAGRIQQEKGFSPTFIALTGYGHAEDKDRAREAGFHFHLTKPVGLREVEAAFQAITPVS